MGCNQILFIIVYIFFFFLKLQAEKYIWLNYFEPPITKLYKFGHLLVISKNLAKLKSAINGYQDCILFIGKYPHNRKDFTKYTVIFMYD